MKVNLIAAVDPNGVIGINGRLPWYYPEDLQKFKSLTMGETLLMGRKTFESLPGRLEGRKIVILTRDRHFPYGEWGAPGVLEGVQRAAKLTPGNNLWIAGGSMVYEKALRLIGLVDNIYLTLVPEVTIPPGSKVAYFPTQELDSFREVSSVKSGPLTYQHLQPIQP